jgi:metal-responsive CopG/Arc/MetJ family transcriptional regulator
MDPELLRQADRFWRVNGVRSRSALVEEALRIYLAGFPEEAPPPPSSVVD